MEWSVVLNRYSILSGILSVILNGILSVILNGMLSVILSQLTAQWN